MASYYPGMQGSYSFPTHIGGDQWPLYGHDYQYPVTKGTTPLISGVSLDGPTWGVSLLKLASGNDYGDISEYLDHYGFLDSPITYDANPVKTIKTTEGGYSLALGHGDDIRISGIPQGNVYDAGEEVSPYQKPHNKNKLLPITGGQYGSGPGYGLANRATLYTITEKYDGTQTIATFGEELPLALTSVIKTGVFEGDFYSTGTAKAATTTTKAGKGTYESTIKATVPKSFFGLSEQEFGSDLVMIGDTGTNVAVQPISAFNQQGAIYNKLFPASSQKLMGWNEASGLLYNPLSEKYTSKLFSGLSSRYESLTSNNGFENIFKNSFQPLTFSLILK